MLKRTKITVKTGPFPSPITLTSIYAEQDCNPKLYFRDLKNTSFCITKFLINGGKKR